MRQNAYKVIFAGISQMSVDLVVRDRARLS